MLIDHAWVCLNDAIFLVLQIVYVKMTKEDVSCGVLVFTEQLDNICGFAVLQRSIVAKKW